MQVSGDSYNTVINEVQQVDNIKITVDREEKKPITEELPEDVIDLFDDNQVNFYKDNNIVNEVIKYIISSNNVIISNEVVDKFTIIYA